jgi:capsular exopolysaccharide synthesis family protein
LSDSKGKVAISRDVDQDIVSVRQEATPSLPSRPGVVSTVILAVALGLALGIVILVLIDQFDDRVASFTEFQASFPDRVLAQIPSAPQAPGATELLALRADDERHAFAESFRSLRSSLVFLPVEGAAPKVLLVTSAAPNEGKSTVTVNLAITLALGGMRVLLVDGDLRRGEIHRTFDLSNERGLSDVLMGDCALHTAAQETRIPGLSLLSRGTSVSNPGELYLSRETDLLLKNAYSKYDYVILDSSPVMAADDTTSLAPKADATIFIFRFTSSQIRMSQKALSLLAERQANIIGVVCNDVSEAMQEYYYYRYPAYYATGQKQTVRTGT